ATTVRTHWRPTRQGLRAVYPVRTRGAFGVRGWPWSLPYNASLCPTRGAGQPSPDRVPRRPSTRGLATHNPSVDADLLEAAPGPTDRRGRDRDISQNRDSRWNRVSGSSGGEERGELGSIRNIQPTECILQVLLHRVDGDLERIAQLAGREAAGSKDCDLFLPGREPSASDPVGSRRQAKPGALDRYHRAERRQIAPQSA